VIKVIITHPRVSGTPGKIMIYKKEDKLILLDFTIPPPPSSPTLLRSLHLLNPPYKPLK